jgi:anaerobic selenocysteine-containing dehydrogenase
MASATSRTAASRSSCDQLGRGDWISSSGEIKRCKAVGPGAICVANGSHHQWGNLGHYLSAFNRFWNLIGTTKLVHNPDSWEGWFWGAMHHWGNSMRLGCGRALWHGRGLPERSRHDGVLVQRPGCRLRFRRHAAPRWAKELGIKMVHIDPYMNHTAAHLGGKWFSPKPGTDAAFAQALCHVWITEGTYDKEFVEKRTTGFAEWKAYILGESTASPRRPSGRKAKPAFRRASCAHWPASGAEEDLSRCRWLGLRCRRRLPRTDRRIQWARMMTILGAMQGMGRPGSNFGNLQFGAPVDMNFYFPGYAEGSMSGDLAYSANSTNNYQRMPHIITMSTVKQAIPRMWLPEAITKGKAMGYLTAVDSVQGQFFPFGYPSPGHVPVQMLYKYGSASFGTMVDANRWVNMYQHDSLKFVVNQSVWWEGETPFADVILPACTVFERWDIGEWYNVGPATCTTCIR